MNSENNPPGIHPPTPGAEQARNPGIYSEAGFMVDQSSDGLRLYKPKDINVPGILSLSVGVGHYSDEPSLQVLVRDKNYPDRIAAMEYSMNNVSQTSIQNPATREKLQRLQNTPVDERLIMAGFEPVESQDPGKSLYRFRKQNPNDQTKEVDLLATVVPDPEHGPRLEALYEPVVVSSAIDDLIKKSHIVGTEVRYSESMRRDVVGLRLSTGALDYSISTHFSSTPQNARLTREMTAEELGIRPVEKRTEPTGFVIGGVNKTELILRLPTITGELIAELTERMQPGVISEAGFLGPEDDLRATMARDNEVVLRAGLTHEQLADPLKKVRRLTELGVPGQTFDIEGHQYRVEIIASQGAQGSPFNDSLNGSNDYTITNLETGASVSTSSLGMQLVEHYGFYQGVGTTYRSAPEEIIRTFTHLQKKVDATSLQEVVRGADQLLR